MLKNSQGTLMKLQPVEPVVFQSMHYVLVLTALSMVIKL